MRLSLINLLILGVLGIGIWVMLGVVVLISYEVDRIREGKDWSKQRKEWLQIICASIALGVALFAFLKFPYALTYTVPEKEAYELVGQSDGLTVGIYRKRGSDSDFKVSVTNSRSTTWIKFGISEVVLSSSEFPIVRCRGKGKNWGSILSSTSTLGSFITVGDLVDCPFSVPEGAESTDVQIDVGYIMAKPAGAVFRNVYRKATYQLSLFGSRNSE